MKVAVRSFDAIQTIEAMPIEVWQKNRATIRVGCRVVLVAQRKVAVLSPVRLAEEVAGVPDELLGPLF